MRRTSPRPVSLRASTVKVFRGSAEWESRLRSKVDPVSGGGKVEEQKKTIGREAVQRKAGGVKKEGGGSRLFSDHSHQDD